MPSVRLISSARPRGPSSPSTLPHLQPARPAAECAESPAQLLLSFMAKWSGLEFLAGRGGRPGDKAPAEQTVPETSRTVDDAFVVQHCLDVAAQLAATGDSGQAVFHYDRAAGTMDVVRYARRLALTRQIGRGTFAAVHKALDTATGRALAVKQFSVATIAGNPRLQATLVRELGALKLLAHPSLVGFEGLLVTRTHIGLLQEFVEGQELFTLLESRRVLGEPEARPLVRQLAAALALLHAHNVVHRDLKLENIMVTPQGAVKLIDFGLARLDAEPGRLLQTRCGSEEYVAPEVLQGQPYDARLSDAWSLGVVVYALLVGALPFNPDPRCSAHVGPRSVSNKILQGRYFLPDGLLSAEATALLRGLLEPRPARRWSVAAALASAFLAPA